MGIKVRFFFGVVMNVVDSSGTRYLDPSLVLHAEENLRLLEASSILKSQEFSLLFYYDVMKAFFSTNFLFSYQKLLMIASRSFLNDVQA